MAKKKIPNNSESSLLHNKSLGKAIREIDSKYSPQKTAKQEITRYRSTLKNVWPIAIASYLAAAFLINEGVQGLRIYSVESGDPFRIISGYIPICLAAIIVIGSSYFVWKNYNRRLAISPQELVYREGNGPISRLQWNSISLQIPYKKKSSIFSIARATDGQATVQIEKFFFNEFDDICQELKQAKNNVTL